MNFLITLMFITTSCATSSRSYLFPRGKQRHEVSVYAADGRLNAQSTNFLLLNESEARMTSLSPASFTAMKAIAKRDGSSELLYLHPSLQEQEKVIQELLKRLAKLLWAPESSDVKVFKRFEDGTAEELEWRLAKQRIQIRVVKL